MKAFIVTPTYKIINNKPYVHLYARQEDGKSCVAIIEQKPYFYIKKSDIDKATNLMPLNIDEKKSGYTNFDQEELICLTFISPKDVPEIRKMLTENEIRCYEADVHFAYRYLIDNNIKSSIIIEGKTFSTKEYNALYNTNYEVDVVYFEPTITPNDHWPELKILSIDIETDMQSNQIYSISFDTKEYKKVFIQKEGLYLNADSFATEKELLEATIKKIKELDPDIIIGWNIVDFDLLVLKNACQRHGLSFNVGRDNSAIYIKLAESFYQDSIAKIEGRVVLDGIAALKTAFITLPDYKLSTASKVLLGDDKLITGDDRHGVIDDYYKTQPQKLIDYNLKDAELVTKIMEKTNVINLAIARSKLTRMQLDRVKASIASLDSLYLEQLQKRKVVAPTAHISVKDEPITGGYVRDSTPGLYHNIVVLDFKSLYPSIIRTFNIDPYSFVSKEKYSQLTSQDKEQLITSPNGAHFRNEEGILPGILEELWIQRDIAKKEKNESKSYAIKILMNSFYGVLANPTCRFYNTDLANAITHFGQHLIKVTADEMTKKGYDVIYGDTDSIFINIKEKDYETSVKLGHELGEEINAFFQNYIKQEYKRTSKMEIEFDKVYKHFLMPRIRGSEVGAKKRYAGILVDENTKVETLDIVGLESVRSDWTQISKKFQQEILMKVFKDEKFTEYIRNFVKDLKKGKYDELLSYRKQIRKGVEEYTKTTPPHIQAARKIGRTGTGVIYYVMTTDGPEEIEHRDHPFDYDHYIDKQLRPVADSILDFYGQTFDDIVQSHRQQSLFDFG